MTTLHEMANAVDEIRKNEALRHLCYTLQGICLVIGFIAGWAFT